jgi:hypothetical protein
MCEEQKKGTVQVRVSGFVVPLPVFALPVVLVEDSRGIARFYIKNQLTNQNSSNGVSQATRHSGIVTLFLKTESKWYSHRQFKEMCQHTKFCITMTRQLFLWYSFETFVRVLFRQYRPIISIKKGHVRALLVRCRDWSECFFISLRKLFLIDSIVIKRLHTHVIRKHRNKSENKIDANVYRLFIVVFLLQSVYRP